jgi:type IV pilus assembly protein PilO
MKNMPWYGSLVIAVLIFALAFFFYFKPRQEELGTLRAERIKVEDEVRVLKQKERELKKIEAELVTLNAQLKSLESIIPLRKETADILKQIQALAYDSRLELIRYAPQREVQRDFYSELPIPIEITGSYHNLGGFFDRLSRFPRLFTVERFSIRALPQQTDLSTVRATWTAKTYFFTEEPQAPASTSQQARPKR